MALAMIPVPRQHGMGRIRIQTSRLFVVLFKAVSAPCVLVRVNKRIVGFRSYFKL